MSPSTAPRPRPNPSQLGIFFTCHLVLFPVKKNLTLHSCVECYPLSLYCARPVLNTNIRVFEPFEFCGSSWGAPGGRSEGGAGVLSRAGGGDGGAARSLGALPPPPSRRLPVQRRPEALPPREARELAAPTAPSLAGVGGLRATPCPATMAQGPQI